MAAFQLNYLGVKPSPSPLWTASFSLSINLSPLLLALQGIQCLSTLLYYPQALPDISGRAHIAKKMACRPFARSGARYSALPHWSRPLPTASGHLGPPQRVSRGRLG